MSVALYLAGAILLALLVYGLIAAGIGILFWGTVCVIILGLVALGVRSWLTQQALRKSPNVLSERRLERKANKALNQLETQLQRDRKTQETPQQQKLRR